MALLHGTFGMKVMSDIALSSNFWHSNNENVRLHESENSSCEKRDTVLREINCRHFEMKV